MDQASPLAWKTLRRSQYRALQLCGDLLRDVYSYVLAQAPVEACGFLAGRRVADTAVVEVVFPVPNISEATDRFTLAHRDMDDAARRCANAGLDMVALFHSHAGDSTPSRLDAAQMPLLPLIWMIVGGTSGGTIDGLGIDAFQASRTGIRRIPVAMT